MAKTDFRNVSKKLLSPTEHQAIEKLRKLHQPVLKEMERWQEQREKLETTLLDQIEMIGKVLEPYYKQSKDTLMTMAGQRRAASTYPNKKSSTKKKSRSTTKKSRSR